jgi:glycosyltransferase involved in cell wall biosynthesis
MKGIFVVHSDYDSLVKKGVLEGIRQRDEDGFLNKVWTVHPFALHDREIKISNSHILLEYRQPPSSRYRAVSWLLFFYHILRVTLSVRHLAKENNVDFVRSQDPYFCGLVGYLATRKSSVNFCVSLHADYDKMDILDPVRGAPRIFGSRRPATLLERFVLSKADRVLVISDYMARYAVRHGARAESVRLFRHRIGVNFSQSKQRRLLTDRPVLALVSRLSRQKYILDLPVLVSELASLRRDFCVEVAGDGPERADLENELQARGLSKYVHLLGFQSADQVESLFCRACASIVFIGGFSLIESAAVACPVVAYDCEWHSEVVEDGISGFLVREGDSVAAARAAAKLLNDSDLAQKMGVELRNRVATMYDDSRLIEQRREVYRELVQHENSK